MSVEIRPQLSREQEVTLVTFGEAFQEIHEDKLTPIGEVMNQAGESNPPLVVIDLAGVDFFGSSFIELLFRLWNRLNKRGGRFVLCNVQKYCLEALQVTNLTTLWTVCGTREEALSTIQSPTR